MSYALMLGGVAVVNLLGAASPGPAFVTVTRISVAESRGTALGAGLGVVTGSLAWATAATLGVGALLVSVAAVFTLLKLAGGAYLVWLGVQAWRHAGAPPPSETGVAVAARMTPLRAWRLGLATNLSNPKVIVFFGSIFVALFAPDTPLWVRFAALGTVACTEALWYSLVVLVFSAPPIQAGYRAARRWVERVTGTVMIVFGTRLLLTARS